MAASPCLLASGGKFRQDVVWLGCSCLSLRCICQDASETPRPVSTGQETDGAVVSAGSEGSSGGVDADSSPECVVLYFDFKAFERATQFEHEYAIDLWARWHSIVDEERKSGSRYQYISVCIEVSFFPVCLCLCAWQELSVEPGAARVEAAPARDTEYDRSRVWLILNLEMFQDASGLGWVQSSQLFGRWISQVHSSRLWGPRRERVAFRLEELPRLDWP